MLRDAFDDWAILFTPYTGRGGLVERECQARCFGLNRTGAYLWKLLDGWHRLDALLEEIRDRTEGVPEEAGDIDCNSGRDAIMWGIEHRLLCSAVFIKTEEDPSMASIKRALVAHIEERH